MLTYLLRRILKRYKEEERFAAEEERRAAKDETRCEDDGSECSRDEIARERDESRRSREVGKPACSHDELPSRSWRDKLNGESVTSFPSIID